MSPFLLTSVLIVAIMATVVVVAITSLGSSAKRIAVVIAAITGLVVALPPVFEALRPEPAAQPTAPSAPLATASPAGRL